MKGNISMKKIISLLMITAITLTLLTACASKVKIKDTDTVSIAYNHDETKVSSTLTGNNASLVIDNLSGLEITDKAPEGANYVEGVYFKVGEQFFYVDLGGSAVLKVDDKGYVELEHYRFHALVALFEQFGVHLHSH